MELRSNAGREPATPREESLESAWSSTESASFRREVRAWLEARLVGDFASLRGRGGPGDEHFATELRRAWERAMAQAGWTCPRLAARVRRPRRRTLAEQVVFHEEYARAGAPGRLGHIGEELLGPTLIACSERRRRSVALLAGDPARRRA